MMKLYLIKATGEICQEAYPIDGYTLMVYIIGSAEFGKRGTISQPIYKTVKTCDLQPL